MPPSLADIETALVSHSEDQLCDGYCALLQIPAKYAVIHAAVTDSLFPESSFANFVVVLIVRSSEMIKTFL
jgi:hypothetical protein